MVHITTGRLLGCLIILGSIFLLSAGLVEGEPHAPRGLLRPAFQRPPIPWRVVGAGATCPQLGGGARGPTEMKEPRRVGASLWMQEAGTSPGAAAADGASGEGPSRKQRRRLNRKTRNNSRNRIASDESGESSIRRNTELSQHFLTDKIIIERLVAEAKDHSSQGSCVVELGPGLGAITAPLLELYPKMTAVELDGLAVAELRGRFPVAFPAPPAPTRALGHHGKLFVLVCPSTIHLRCIHNVHACSLDSGCLWSGVCV